jgi:mannosyl-3-phosphoglycerate phosphatase
VKQQLVVFTDLDGTLLDKETYSFAAALPTLRVLVQHNIPLILNSSKTVAEIVQLRQQLNNNHPFVVENGAAVLIPQDCFDSLDTTEMLILEPQSPPYFIKRFSQSYEQIVTALTKARAEGFKFAGFSDWSAQELADISGLDMNSAVRAKQRMGTEPILLKGDKALFDEYLREFGLRSVQGGRFLHVMGQYDKSDGVKWLLQAYQSQCETLTSIALGDSHNDEGMLNSVAIPVIIKSPHSDSVNLKKPTLAIYSTLPGPKGWNETMQTLLHTHLTSSNGTTPA